MFDYLHIYDPQERALVGMADAALRLVTPVLRVARRPRAQRSASRILLLRLERIGDLLMSLEGIEDVVRSAPGAEVDLVVGSWNAELARRIRGIRQVETMDASWLARGGSGIAMAGLLPRARAWRARGYDIGLNFEPDIRSNLLLAASGARLTAGFGSGGGGPLLDVALPYDQQVHTAVNAQRLAAAVFRVTPRTAATRLELSDADRARAADRLAERSGPLIGLHVSGGRAIKQWDPERFAELAVRLAHARAATIVLTGSEADREIIRVVARRLDPGTALDLSGALDLPDLAAVLERLDVFVTGDTGPMHVAAAVGTPVVAVFGPSSPVRYAPRDPMHRIVRIELPCSPCNRIRLPPERCRGHIPDCLTGIDVEMVYRATEAILDGGRRREFAVRLQRG